MKHCEISQSEGTGEAQEIITRHKGGKLGGGEDERVEGLLDNYKQRAAAGVGRRQSKKSREKN